MTNPEHARSVMHSAKQEKGEKLEAFCFWLMERTQYAFTGEALAANPLN